MHTVQDHGPPLGTEGRWGEGEKEESASGQEQTGWALQRFLCSLPAKLYSPGSSFPLIVENALSSFKTLKEAPLLCVPKRGIVYLCAASLASHAVVKAIKAQTWTLGPQLSRGCSRAWDVLGRNWDRSGSSSLSCQQQGRPYARPGALESESLGFKYQLSYFLNCHRDN